MIRAHSIAPLAAALTFLVATPLWASTWTVFTDGDADTSGNCTQTTCTLRDAITTAVDGDTIQFQMPTTPDTITLTQGPLGVVAKGLTFNGPGAENLTISGNNASQVIFFGTGVSSGSFVSTINNLTIANGNLTGYTGANGANPGANGQIGGDAYGGCIEVGAGYTTLNLNFDVVTGCNAYGGQGGDGAKGATGSTGATGADGTPTHPDGYPGGDGLPGQNGGHGGNGGAAYGGAIYSAGNLFLNSTSVINSNTYSGNGGAGAAGGTGGTGGSGGNCNACYAGTYPGNGGNGGNGGIGGNEGNGGFGGDSVGGGVFASPHAFSAINSTIANNSSYGGFSGSGQTYQRASGGAGGNGGVGYTQDGYSWGQPGTSGSVGALGTTYADGRAFGGGIFTNITDPATGSNDLLEQSTVAYNFTISGTNADTSPAFVMAGGVYSIGASMTVWNSIVASNGAGTYDTQQFNNCWDSPKFTLANDNLDNGVPGAGQCGFDVHDTQVYDLFAYYDGDTFPIYARSWGGNGLPVMMIANGSLAQGGAAVHGTVGNQYGGCATTSGTNSPSVLDERGASRPNGYAQPVGGIGFIWHPAACDLGAVQNDIIFRDGFGN